MTEDEARAWLDSRFSVSRETLDHLERYVAMLLDEADNQNLISASTRDIVWARHIVDSAQLIFCAKDAPDGPWVDLGAGAGLPAIVVAILTDRPVIMIENRRGRVAFLNAVIDDLGLSNAQVIGQKVEVSQIAEPAAVISARAFAPLPKLIDAAAHLANGKTIWVLPKGKTWQNELDNGRGLWQDAFHVEHSVTDPESAILVGRGIIRKGRRG